MDNNEFSFESIFAAGIGMPVEKTVEVQSEERFDGFLDATFAEISRSEEDIQFLETYGSMEDLNTKAKLNMLSKINKAYGKCNRGIENYCRSLEAETDGTAALKEDEKPAEEGKTVDPKTIEKKKNWLKSVLTAIGKFFKKIWDAIVSFFKNMVSKIKNLFAKNKAKKDLKEAAETKPAETKPAETKPAETKLPTSGSTSSSANKIDVMNPDMVKQLEKALEQTYGHINRLQPFVNKVCAKNDEAIKDLDKIVKDVDGKSNSEIFKTHVYDNLLVCSASIKLMSQLGQIVLKSAQKMFNNITHTEQVIASSFDKFLAEYSKASKWICDAYDKIKNHKTGATKEIREAFGNDIYEFYNTIVVSVKRLVGYNAPVITKTDFTNPSSSGKNISEMIKKLSSGISETFNDRPVAFKRLVKDLFGVVIEDKFFENKSK